MELSKAQKRNIEKKKQVKGKTIVAIDPASKKHQVAILSPEAIPMMRSFRIFNSGEGFKRLLRKLEGIKQEFPTTEFLFAIEPSAQYWIPLLFFFKKRGFEFVLVPGLFVKRSREIEDHTSRQDDPKDAHIIGELALHGKYCDEHQPQEIYAELRNFSNDWLELSEKKAALRLKIRMLLDQYFPEFLRLFSDFLGATGRFLLSLCPFPVHVLQQNLLSLREQVYKISRRRIDDERVMELKQAAETSVGIDQGIAGARFRLRHLLEDYESCERHQQEIISEIEAYLNCIDYTPFLLSLPGVGLVSVMLLLGQTGDLTQFNTVADLISYAGLDLIYGDSGNRVGHRHISKRGRKQLRLVLYRMTLAFLQQNNIARRKYLNQRLTGKKPTQAIVSSISFFVRVMFAVVKEQRYYRPLDPSDPLVQEINQLENQLAAKLKNQDKHINLKKAA
jgi:transposase